MILSFRLKTVIGIALIETIALGVLIWSSVNYLHDSNEQALAKRAEGTIQLFAVMTQDSVIATDLAKLDSLVSELLKLPETRYVRIHGQRQVLAEGGEQAYLKQPFERDLSFDRDDDGIFDIDTDIEIHGERFGRVELGLSIEELEKLVDEARVSLGVIALVEILAVAFFSLALGAYLTKSLNKLKDAANQIKTGELGVTVPVNSGDELGQVALAFNQMSHQILDNHRSQEELLASSRDLTEDLKRSELRMRTVMNTAVDGFVIIDHQGTIIEVNESTESTFGYSREEMIGSNVSMLMPPNDAKKHDGYLQRYLDDGVAHVIGTNQERSGMRRNGEIFPMELTVSEIKQGDEILFVGLVHDLTEIKQAQNQLSFLEAIKNGITEASLDALITIDEHGAIIDFNSSAENMYNLPKASVLGRDISEVIIPESMREAHKKGMQKYLETGEGPVIGKRIEVTSIRNGHEEFPVELTVTPIKIKDKTFFTAFIRDISEQNAQKEALHDAIDAAERANEAKSKFLASMSHEVRTPINAVLGAIDLLEDSHMEAFQKKYIQLAQNSGQSLLSIVNNILDFSKIDSGAMEITETEFLLHQLIDDVVFMFGATAQEKYIEILSCISQDVPASIIGDKGKLRQILINLVSNAIKFTRAGGVIISVRVIHLADGPGLEFNIRDSGIGIEDEAIPQLFRDFSQVENQLSAEYDGSGLGLSICKSLVEIMQGSISVESVVGKGSEFCFELPFKESSIDSPVEAHQFGFIKSVRLLTRNPIQKTGFEEQLRQLGLDVVNDPEAQYDVAIIDESMLDKDFQFNDQARFRILLTFEHGRAHEAQELAWDHVVIKPVMSLDLKKILNGEFSAQSDLTHSHKTQQITSLKGKHILVVDDSEANQLIAKGMLEKAGYHVSLADSGFTAIEQVKSGRFDLVLMDVRMPKMDGLRATQEIRSLGTLQANIPIIALTANAVKQDLQKCIRVGMNSYLTKPVNREEMLQAISDLLDDGIKKHSVNSKDRPVSSKQLIDENAFQVLAEETSPDLVIEMVEIFLGESRQRVKHILEADIESELEMIGDEAHTLKSTSFTFGAQALYRVTLSLDKACKDKSMQKVRALIQELDQVAAKTFSWFETEFASRFNPNQ